jgi:hypothetical protein
MSIIEQPGEYRVVVGDTIYPLNVLVTNGAGQPLDLSSYTVKFTMKNAAGTTVIAETADNVVKQPTQALSVVADANTVLKASHGVRDGDRLIFATSGTLPSGLTTAMRPYAIAVTDDTFQLSLTKDGPAIDISTAGTGDHTFAVMGSVQYDLQPSSVTTAGTYKGWFRLFWGSERATVPNNKNGIRILLDPLG